MYKQKVLFFLCFCLCMLGPLFSQVVTNTVGCAPHQINFSAPSGAANWNFGNNNSSTSPSGTYLYQSAGTFVVTYTGAAGTYTQLVIIGDDNFNPGFTFIVPPSGCAPRTVSFTGTGAPPGGVYYWTFGDGGAATGSTTTHPYGPGVFSPTLTVVGQGSCAIPVSYASSTIAVSAFADLVISSSNGFASCASPFVSSFSGSSSTSGSPFNGNLSYNWDFGNGSTSNVVTPGSISYLQDGVFTISLTATDNNNCSTTTTSLVSVVQPTVSVITPTLRCVAGQNPVPPMSPPIYGPAITAILQSSQANVIIDVGDGSPPSNVTLNNGVGTFTYNYYTTPGTKTISVTAYAGTCVATAIQTMIVEQVTAQFTTTAPFFTCSPTLMSNYINQSTVTTNASLTYSWSVTAYNNGVDAANSSTLANPTFTFVQGSTNPYTVFGVYKPKVKLMTVSANNCWQVTMKQLDSIGRPTAWFNKTKSQGCAPLTVILRDSSDVHSVYPMQSYTWSNGASPPVYQMGVMPPAVNNPTFVYAQTGTYTPSYTISTAGGCGDVSFVDTIIVVNPSTPVAAFPTVVCAGNPVTFNLSSSPLTSVVSHWHVETDNGFFSGCINDPNPSWPFTHIGVHNVTVTASDHGCGSTITPVQAITVNGPVGKFSYRNSCVNKTTVTFYPYLRNAENATLYFGDGQSVPLLGNANGLVSFTNTHIYDASGDYVAELTSFNSITNCQYTYTTMIHVRQLQADISLQNVVCRNIATYFESVSIDEDPGCGKGYNWYIDNYPPVQSTSPWFYSDSMKVNGTHTVVLAVKDINGCKSRVTKTFRVTSPGVDFTFNRNPACVSDGPVPIINLTPQAPDSVKNYVIWFGDMTAPLTISSPTAWPLQHSYDYLAWTPSTTYTVKIRGYDVNGCRDSMEHVLQVNDPQALVYPINPKTCINQTVNFLSMGGYTSTIDYGDGQSVVFPLGANNFTHAFANPGIFTVSLVVLDDGGCTATANQTVHIEGYPSADFIFSDNLGLSNSNNRFCTPVDIKAQSISLEAPNSPITDYLWNFGTGQPIFNASVAVINFSNTGVSTVTLTTLTGNGCSSTKTHTFIIMTVTATPQINKTRLCVGESVQLSLIDTSSVNYWSWNFSDGNNATFYALANPTQTYTRPFNSYPEPSGVAEILFYYSAGGGSQNCEGKFPIPIQIVKVESDFGRNLELTQIDYEHCVNITDQFANKSKHNNSNILSGLRFLWGFGTGATSTVQSSSYTYTQAGVYIVTLTVTDAQLGCTHSVSKSMTIHPLPTVSVSATDSVCRNSTLSLYSKGSADIVTYTWIPSAGVVNPNVANTTATASVSTSYSLQVENNFGCKAYSYNTASVYVQQPPLTPTWDTTIIIGQTPVLNANQGPGFTYTWSPLTDLSCSTCPYPISTTTNNITYSVEVMDPMMCFKVTGTYSVLVDPLTSVDVPTAFTPNGDGVNDVIYVDGWGIKKLLFFRIFNRWGQVIFESSDIRIGWDGTYNGVPQNMETYIYQVSVETYVPGKTMEKTSSFKLIR